MDEPGVVFVMVVRVSVVVKTSTEKAPSDWVMVSTEVKVPSRYVSGVAVVV